VKQYFYLTLSILIIIAIIIFISYNFGKRSQSPIVESRTDTLWFPRIFIFEEIKTIHRADTLRETITQIDSSKDEDVFGVTIFDTLKIKNDANTYPLKIIETIVAYSSVREIARSLWFDSLMIPERVIIDSVWIPREFELQDKLIWGSIGFLLMLLIAIIL
jgi:hypothetical protein